MKVFVGLSGGVDSAVSAALLKQQGHDVVGAFIKIWSPEFLECTWKEDRLDAMRVCAALRIPFREVDLSEEYKSEVVRWMLEEYEKGVTPNPDVLCNRTIKFGHFASWAFGNGADMVATGHYARSKTYQGEPSISLLRGKDAHKDQSYFLYRLGQRDLARTLFPIGEYTKPQVREMSQRFALPNASRPDSQGLCFVGDVTMKEFLGRFIELHAGNVVDRDNKVVGSHGGAALYTIGERHGFTSAGAKAQYVVGVDVPRNVICVSPQREDAASGSRSLADIHWIGKEPAFPLTAKAQARYREHPFEVRIERSTADPDSLSVHFEQPHIAAPGQSLVLYSGEECLGGGIINSGA